VDGAAIHTSPVSGMLRIFNRSETDPPGPEEGSIPEAHIRDAQSDRAGHERVSRLVHRRGERQRHEQRKRVEADGGPPDHVERGHFEREEQHQAKRHGEGR
jgi:hypothetical protein